MGRAVGAGTSHTATFLRAIGPEPWKAAYVQPSRRPKDGRYGDNPTRLQHYSQYQVVLKPSPDDIQEMYLGSLEAIVEWHEELYERQRVPPLLPAGSQARVAPPRTALVRYPATPPRRSLPPRGPVPPPRRQVKIGYAIIVNGMQSHSLLVALHLLFA
mgnify:CR=1 FL=1